jgi:signal transduction histidine kinase
MRPLAGVGPRRRILLVAATVASLVSIGYFGRFLLKPYTGLVVNFPEAVSRDGRILFAPRSPLSPAVRAGLLPYRDQIVRVGEHPISTLRDLVDADLAWETYRPAVIEALRDSTQRTSVLLDPDLALRRLESAFSAAFLLALIALAFVLLLDRGAEAGLELLAAACLCYAVFVSVKPFYYENLGANLLVHIGKTAPWFLLSFALYYPRPRFPAVARAFAGGVIAGAYLLFAASRLSLFAAWSVSGADALLARYRDLGRIANVAETAGYVLFVLLLGTSLRRAGPIEKSRIQWMLAAFVVALPPYFFFDQLPLILDDAAVPRVGTGGYASLFLLPLPVLFTVGLVTGRSLEARRLLARLLVHAFAAVAALAFLAWLYDPLVVQLTTHYALSVRAASFVAVFAVAAFLIAANATLVGPALHLLDAPSRRLRALIRERAAFRRALSRTAAEQEHDRQQEIARLLRHVERELDGAAERSASALAALEAAGREPSRDDALRDALVAVRGERSLVLSLAETLRPMASLSGGLPEPCDAHQLVQVALGRLRQRCPGARVEARVDALRVRVVPQHVIAALGEILANAYESAPDGVITVVSRRDGDTLRIEVVDQGGGFTQDMAAAAARPFAGDKAGHSGMGLYLARRAVALSGGRLGIEQGRGGRVWMELPVA